MKKAFIFALALSMVFSMVTFAAAEDRLSLSGDIRIRYFYQDDRDWNGDAEDSVNYFDQRLRMGTRIQVMDGIAIRLRVDWQETQWGQNTGLFGRPTAATDDDAAVQIDRAFLQINKPMFDFLIGHIAQYWGHSSAYGPQEMGMALTVKTPVELVFNYFKLTENGSLNDDEWNDDRDMYALKATYPNDSPRTVNKVGAYVAMINDSTDADDSPYLVGLFGGYNFGSVVLKSSLDFFGGDDGNNEYMGTQFWAGLDFPISKMLTAAFNFYYALGTDDPTETQLDQIHTRFGGFEGPVMERSFFGETDSINALGNSTPFKPFGGGENSGVVGADAVVIYKFTPEFAAAGQLGYYAAEEDDATTFDSLFAITGAFEWTFAKGSHLVLIGSYGIPDKDASVADDEKMEFVSILKVKY